MDATVKIAIGVGLSLGAAALWSRSVAPLTLGEQLRVGDEAITIARIPNERVAIPAEARLVVAVLGDGAERGMFRGSLVGFTMPGPDGTPVQTTLGLPGPPLDLPRSSVTAYRRNGKEITQ